MSNPIPYFDGHNDVLLRLYLDKTGDAVADFLNGLRAGIAAGLGIAAHSARLMPAGLVELPAPHDLPALGEVEFVAIGPGHQHAAASALINALTGGRG